MRERRQREGGRGKARGRANTAAGRADALKMNVLCIECDLHSGFRYIVPDRKINLIICIVPYFTKVIVIDL